MYGRWIGASHVVLSLRKNPMMPAGKESGDPSAPTMDNRTRNLQALPPMPPVRPPRHQSPPSPAITACHAFLVGSTHATPSARRLQSIWRRSQLRLTTGRSSGGGGRRPQHPWTSSQCTSLGCWSQQNLPLLVANIDNGCKKKESSSYATAHRISKSARRLH